MDRYERNRRPALRSRTRNDRNERDGRESKFETLQRELNNLTDLIGDALQPDVKVTKGDTVIGGFGSRKKRIVTQLGNGDYALTTLEGKAKGELASTMRGTPDRNGDCYLDDLVSHPEDGDWEKLK